MGSLLAAGVRQICDDEATAIVCFATIYYIRMDCSTRFTTLHWIMDKVLARLILVVDTLVELTC